MEYSALAKLPKTSKKRLARAALTSLGLATIYVPVLEFALTDPAAGRSPSWFAGLALWLSSLVVLAISLLIGGKISRAVHFYFLEKAAALPGLLVIFFGGIWMFRGGVNESSTTPYAFGLGAGLVVLPFAIRSRARWLREAIARGLLSRAFNPDTATRDPRYDADHVVKDPRSRRPSCLLSVLFWAGPVLGLAPVDIFGRLTAAVIAGALAAGFGYYAILASTTDLTVLLHELRRFERSLGRGILLPAEFSRGEQPHTGEGGVKNG